MSRCKKPSKAPGQRLTVEYWLDDLTTEQAQQCDALRAENARVWNDALDLRKQIKADEDRWLDEGEIKNRLRIGTKGYHLAANTVQAVIESLVEHVTATVRKRRQGDARARFPWKAKAYRTVTWKKPEVHWTEAGLLQLSNGKGNAPLVLRVPEYWLPLGIVTVHLCREYGRFRLVAQYVKPVPAEAPGDGIAGLDPGYRHLITMTDGTSALMISGKRLAYLNHAQGEALKEISAKMARCKKGSRRYKRLKTARRKTQGLFSRRVEQMLHSASKMAVKWATEHGVGTIAYGDLSGITETDKGRKQNRRLRDMRADRIRFMVGYKAKLRGIAVVNTDEAYTSQTCPLCLSRAKTADRNYRCPSGHHLHRDLVGAVNIRSKGEHGHMVPVPEMPQNFTYRQPCKQGKAVVGVGYAPASADHSAA